jgi:hypothetical protein
MRQCHPRNRLVLRYVVHPPIVFFPGHLAGIGQQILAGNVMVLAEFRSAHPAEKTLGQIGASSVQAVTHGMVDPTHLIIGVQPIPPAGFTSMND